MLNLSHVSNNVWSCDFFCSVFYCMFSTFISTFFLQVSSLKRLETAAASVCCSFYCNIFSLMPLGICRHINIISAIFLHFFFTLYFFFKVFQFFFIFFWRKKCTPPPPPPRLKNSVLEYSAPTFSPPCAAAADLFKARIKKCTRGRSLNLPRCQIQYRR